MLEMHAQNFVRAMNMLTRAEQIGRQEPDWFFEQDKKAHINGCMEELEVELQNLDLQLSIKKLRSMKTLYTIGGQFSNATRVKSFCDDFLELKSRIEDELESRAVYCLSSFEATFAHTTPEPFGSLVSKKLPCDPDIEEARKCLAFARYTAAVFHLMRGMEMAVAAAGTALGATVSDKYGNPLEWGKIVANMEAKIEALPRGDKRAKWSRAHAMLLHVKDAWRNPTMHPKDTYTAEQAQEVYSAVKGFMNQLAPLI